MHDDNPSKQLQDATAYLQRVTGQFLTYQQSRQAQDEAQGQRNEQQIRALAQSAQAITGSASRLVDDTVRAIKEQSGSAIAQGVGEELAKMRSQANAAATALQSTLEEFAQQKALLAGERRKYALTWMGGIVMVSVLAVLGVGSYVGAKLRELDALTAKVDYLSVYNAADVAPADDRLWVNIDPKSKRTINGKTYYLVQPR